MEIPGEISLLCRLCLANDEVNVPIFGEQSDIRQISLKISSCLPVKIAADDLLPKNICEGCSDKLELLYTFSKTSQEAEKKLLVWVEQVSVNNASEAITAVAKQIVDSTEVKEESDEGHKVNVKKSFDELVEDAEEKEPESEAPPPKRARRTAAVKAQISISQESEDEDDVDMVEPLTKVEDESEVSDSESVEPHSSFVDVPGTSADEQQPGPSGVQKDGADAPSQNNHGNIKFYCNKCGKPFVDFWQLHRHLFASEDHLFSCPKCSSQVGYTLADLLNHVKDTCGWTEREKRLFTLKCYCDHCGLDFNTLHPLQLHRLTHTDVRLNCDFCDSQTDSVYGLVNHLKAHFEAQLVELTCEMCSLQFKATLPYQQHQLLVHSKLLDITFKCSVCSVILDGDDRYLWHMQKHSDALWYKLPSTVSLRKLNRSIPKCSDIGFKKITCQICSKLFSSVMEANMHKLMFHSLKPDSSVLSKCPVCHVNVKLSDIFAHVRVHWKPSRKQAGPKILNITLLTPSQKSSLPAPPDKAVAAQKATAEIPHPSSVTQETLSLVDQLLATVNKMKPPSLEANATTSGELTTPIKKPSIADLLSLSIKEKVAPATAPPVASAELSSSKAVAPKIPPKAVQKKEAELALEQILSAESEDDFKGMSPVRKRSKPRKTEKRRRYTKDKSRKERRSHRKHRRRSSSSVSTESSSYDSDSSSSRSSPSRKGKRAAKHRSKYRDDERTSTRSRSTRKRGKRPRRKRHSSSYDSEESYTSSSTSSSERRSRTKRSRRRRSYSTSDSKDKTRKSKKVEASSTVEIAVPPPPIISNPVVIKQEPPIILSDSDQEVKPKPIFPLFQFEENLQAKENVEAPLLPSGWSSSDSEILIKPEPATSPFAQGELACNPVAAGGTINPLEEADDKMLYVNPMPIPTIMNVEGPSATFRDKLREVNPMNLRPIEAAEDTEMYPKIIEDGRNIHSFDEPLPVSTSGGTTVFKHLMNLKTIEPQGFQQPPASLTFESIQAVTTTSPEMVSNPENPKPIIESKPERYFSQFKKPDESQDLFAIDASDYEPQDVLPVKPPELPVKPASSFPQKIKIDLFDIPPISSTVKSRRAEELNPPRESERYSPNSPTPSQSDDFPERLDQVSKKMKKQKSKPAPGGSKEKGPKTKPKKDVDPDSFDDFPLFSSL